MGIVGLHKPIRDYVDSLVHPSAQHDALSAARHRAFIAPRLLGSFIALAAFPVYIAMRGIPNALETLMFTWFATPILIAYFLSRTGRYQVAHAFSALALTGLGMSVAAGTGGIGSLAAIWFTIVPLEAALSASRRVVMIALALMLGAVGLLLFLEFQNMLSVPQSSGHALAALGIIPAALYATGLAFGSVSLTRTSSRLLNAEEERYRMFAHNMTDIITRHARNGAILFASPTAGSLFGTQARELFDHGLFDRVHVADRPAYLTALADAAAFGETRSVEFRVRRDAAEPTRSGVQFIWVEMKCRPFDRATNGDSDQDREVVAVIRDINGRKLQEQTIENIRAEAEQAAVAKNKFLAMVSHELRTPLNAIIGFSQMLTNEECMRLDGAQRRSYARIINESGAHLLSLVNDILDSSKMETGDYQITPESFALAPVISSCCDLLALKAREAGLDLVMGFDDGLPEIVADKRAFKQILINLLSNAVKFTGQGGRVTVGAKTDGSTLVMTIEDTGIGICADDLPRLGYPFFQARAAYDRRHDGTGLGLSIVKGLVTLHDGQLDIASRIGKGTCATVRLPMNCARARTAGAKPTNVHYRAFQHVIGMTDNKVKKSA